MSRSRNLLPRPTPDLVRWYINQFDQSQQVVEQALTKLFTYLPENTQVEDVLLKVVALNDLYRTGILATYKVAEHIVKQGIDSALRAGDPAVIDRIARVQLGERHRTNYSFATKYAAWHYPNNFSIYDSFTDQLLWKYQKQEQFSVFRHNDLWHYAQYMTVIRHFQQYYQLTQFSLKDIDKFLWGAGKHYFPPS